MDLFYRQLGEGEPLVILHGIFGISDNWITIGRKLAEKFSVYIPDQRNHGQSPHHSVFNYHALEADLEEFLDARGLGQVNLIGHSMGGKVAMGFTLNNTDRVKRLAVVDISPKAYPPRLTHLKMMEAMRSVDIAHVTTRAEVEQQLGARGLEGRILQFIMKNLHRIGPNSFLWRINLDSLYENIEYMTSWEEHTGRFSGPVMFVKGGKSDYIDTADESLIKTMFPGSVINTIEKASHWVHADAPHELCALFSGFFGKECRYS